MENTQAHEPLPQPEDKPEKKKKSAKPAAVRKKTNAADEASAGPGAGTTDDPKMDAPASGIDEKAIDEAILPEPEPEPEEGIDKPASTTEEEAIQELSDHIHKDQEHEGEHHDEHPETDAHPDDDALDFSGMSREELLAIVKEATDKQDERNINRKVQAVRGEFNRQTKAAQEQALADWIAEGKAEGEYQPAADPLADEFYTAFRTFKKRRQEYINELNRQKEENLRKKKEMLEKLKTLTEHPETRESFQQFKELQNEWRRIGHVPISEAENIWNSYNYFVDRFYEQRSLYSEFKELDRKRNLTAKEDLVKRIEQLLEQEDTVEALKQLRNLQEEWRHIGPVPKEQLEPVIQRYKQAVIKLYEKREAHSQELQRAREENYNAKLALLEKIEQIANADYKNVQEWINANVEIGKWLENWRSVGAVPAAKGQEMKERLSGAIRQFNSRKNDFFRGRKKEKVDHLRRKTELCERVEAILAEENLMAHRKDVIRLQDEWKKVGPVPARYSEKIWKRFQGACDAFFAKVNESHHAQNAEQHENLNKKIAVIEQMEALAKEENPENIREKIRAFQQEFNKIGFVPFKDKDKVRKRFTAALNELLGKLRKKSGEGMDAEHMDYQLQLESWAQEPSGRFRIEQEEGKHRRELKRIENEIATLENNMAFFSHSKTADKLKAGLEKQVEQLRSRMQEIQAKIKMARSVGR